MTAVDAGNDANVIVVKPGTEYKIDQSGVAHDGRTQYPSRVVAFQEYTPNGGSCPAIDLTADPQVQPNMDDTCWKTVSQNQESVRITVPLDGGDQIYRFVNTTLAVAELPNAAGWGALRYVILGTLTALTAATLAWLHARRQSRKHH